MHPRIPPADEFHSIQVKMKTPGYSAIGTAPRAFEKAPSGLPRAILFGAIFMISWHSAYAEDIPGLSATQSDREFLEKVEKAHGPVTAPLATAPEERPAAQANPLAFIRLIEISSRRLEQGNPQEPSTPAESPRRIIPRARSLGVLV